MLNHLLLKVDPVLHLSLFKRWPELTTTGSSDAKKGGVAAAVSIFALGVGFTHTHSHTHTDTHTPLPCLSHLPHS